MTTYENEICEEYKAALGDLTINSKPLINMLTMLAEENTQIAPQILKVIEDQLHKANPIHKLPLLYLIDSIIKNVKQPYLEYSIPNIVNIFCQVFEKVDEKTRLMLYKLRQTWGDIFPQKLMYTLDKAVQKLDPAWPITAQVTNSTLISPPEIPIKLKDPGEKKNTTIHINPKFFPKKTSQVIIDSANKLKDPRLSKQSIVSNAQVLRDIKINNKRLSDKDERVLIEGKIESKKRFRKENNISDVDYRDNEVQSNQFSLIPLDVDKRQEADLKKTLLPGPGKKNNSFEVTHSDSIESMEISISKLIRETSMQGRKGALDTEKQAQILKSAASLMEGGKLSSLQHKTLIQQLQQIFDLFNRRFNFGNHNNANKKSPPHLPTSGNNGRNIIQNQKFNRNNAFRIPFVKKEQNHKGDVDNRTNISPSILSPKPNKDCQMVIIDGVEREIHFHESTGLVLMNDDLPHVISFKMRSPDPTFKTLLLGDIREKLYKDRENLIYLNGRRHSFKLGAPSKELFIDSFPYQIHFGSSSDGDNANVLLDGKAHSIKLLGPPPEVEIDDDPYYDMTNETFENVSCNHCKSYLDNYFLKISESNSKVTIPEPSPVVVFSCQNNIDYRVDEIPNNILLPPPPPFFMMNNVSFPSPYTHSFAQFGPLQPGYLNQMSQIAIAQNFNYENRNIQNSSFNQNITLPPVSVGVTSLHSNPPETFNPPDTFNPPSTPQATENANTIDLNGILSNLVRSGIINANKSSNEDISRQNEEMNDLSDKGLTLEIPELDICDVKALKVKYPGVINSLYNGFQCASCGRRFYNSDSDVQNRRYADHLDYHFRKNRKLKEIGGGMGSIARKMAVRAWYYPVTDWCQLEEVGDFLENSAQGGENARSEIFEQLKLTQHKADSSLLSAAPMIPESVASILRPSDSTHYNEYQTKDNFKLMLNDLQNKYINQAKLEEETDKRFEANPIAGENDACEICREVFDQAWDEDREEWVLKDAMRYLETEKLYHPSCWEEEKPVLQEDLNENIEENALNIKTEIPELNALDNKTTENETMETVSDFTINIKTEYIAE
ncbi:pre-mRNA cleavage complex 2 protein Pcf11-like isoform X2 [Gordionus sp. m RMFG-2023]|uniref:pre-mRNA cleavage complex 2 protein Pcf11-like isoform X2 n=1 Tax=Gordionus sp. m RMFG-2023 TaxID=3053472 RepID=UPI0031FCAE48